MKKYRQKPLIVEAVQYTEDMKSRFIALGKKLEENPIEVDLKEAIAAKLEWNWHTKELELYEDAYESYTPILLGDWIVREKGSFYQFNKRDFLNKYELIEE